ncbi:WG repeat-containing protein [Gracilibacillus oryzae]|nr:WG repeat-containing protein [Gracilibacillus oryzae]
MKKRKKLSIITLLAISLAACSNTNDDEVVKEAEAAEQAEAVEAGGQTETAAKEETTAEEKNGNKLGIGVLKGDQHWQDGLTIYEMVPQESGHYVVTGSNRYGEIFGVLDENLEWMIEPNFEIADITTFADGLIGVAIWDSRPVRAGADEGDNELWGFVNEDGEWAIEPQYREVGEFSEGLAYALTIEEDRDDLANARGIIIDKKGNEIAEVLPSTDYYKYEDIEDYAVYPKFLNGTMDVLIDEDSDQHLIVDSEGNLFDFPVNVTDYFVNGHEVYQVIQENDWKSNIYKTDVKVNDASITPVEITGFDYSSLKFHDTEFFARNKLFEIQAFSDDYQTQLRLYNVEGQKVFEYTAGTLYQLELRFQGEDWVIYENPEIKFDNPDENGYDEAKTFVYIDSEGNSQEFILKYNWELAEYKDRYWEEGTEYAVLKTFDGEILLGEEEKVFMDEVEHGDGNPIVSVKYRANSESTDMLPGFVNLETGELITLEQFTIIEMEE